MHTKGSFCTCARFLESSTDLPRVCQDQPLSACGLPILASASVPLCSHSSLDKQELHSPGRYCIHLQWPKQSWFTTLKLLASNFLCLPLLPQLLMQNQGRVTHQDLQTLHLQEHGEFSLHSPGLGTCSETTHKPALHLQMEYLV